MKKIYFAGSIRGGREDLALYAALIARLQERAEVLTEFIGESTLEDQEAATMTDYDIYERDMALLREADAIVAECSTPSLGVGYELGSAYALGLPAYILPLNLIPIGHPKGDPQPKDKYNPDNIHFNGW